MGSPNQVLTHAARAAQQQGQISMIIELAAAPGNKIIVKPAHYRRESAFVLLGERAALFRQRELNMTYNQKQFLKRCFKVS